MNEEEKKRLITLKEAGSKKEVIMSRLDGQYWLFDVSKLGLMMSLVSEKHTGAS